MMLVPFLPFAAMILTIVGGWAANLYFDSESEKMKVKIWSQDVQYKVRNSDHWGEKSESENATHHQVDSAGATMIVTIVSRWTTPLAFVLAPVAHPTSVGVKSHITPGEKKHDTFLKAVRSKL